MQNIPYVHALKVKGHRILDGISADEDLLPCGRNLLAAARF